MARSPIASAPVFIVGQPRSGSSILYRLLLEHPAFRQPVGAAINLTESHVIDALLTTPDLDTPSVRSFAELDDGGWDAFQTALAASRLPRRLLRRIPGRIRDRGTWCWRVGGGLAALETFTAHAARGRGVGRLVEKTPTHLGWIAPLLASGPDTRVLSICRHPVPVFASYRRRAALDADAASWADVSVEAFVENWRAEATSVVRWLDHPRFRMVGYEELVDDPATVSAGLFAWLGEDAPVSELDTVELSPFTPRSDAKQLGGPIGRVAPPWVDHVTPAEAAQIVDALGPLIEQLGRPAP